MTQHQHTFLAAQVADLQTPVRWKGAAKPVLGLLTLMVLVIFSATRSDLRNVVALAALAGFVYASVVLTTHDAIHRTLTPNRRLDAFLARALAYPGLWFHGVYGILHLLHHRANGIDAHDPERTQWTVAEYRAAGRFRRWRMRNSWIIDLFFLGGLGIIIRHVRQGLRLAHKDPAMHRRLIEDFVGIATTQAVLYFLFGWRWLVCFLVMERITGFFQQLRGHVEHEGLWGGNQPRLISHALACRNIRASAIISTYFNHLNYHSMHHAFPRIPRQRLREAHERLEGYFTDLGQPLVQGPSYLGAARDLIQTPAFLDEEHGKIFRGIPA